jgi:hypothetical protein
MTCTELANRLEKSQPGIGYAVLSYLYIYGRPAVPCFHINQGSSLKYFEESFQVYPAMVLFYFCIRQKLYQHLF